SSRTRTWRSRSRAAATASKRAAWCCATPRRASPRTSESGMPTSEDKSLVSRAAQHVRRTFVAGTLTALPLGVTFLVLRWIFGLLDGLFAPFFDQALGMHIPGLGVTASLLVFYLFGMISANVIGRQFQGGLERLMSRLPVTRTIYASAKQVVETFSARGN